MKHLSNRDLAGIKKILVIQLGPFGDGLLTTSYFETLKRRMPGAELWYVIKEPYDAVVRGHPSIDNLITIKARKRLAYALERLRTIRRIRAEKFDLVIDQQNMPSSQHLTLLSGARYRLGYRDGRLWFAYNLRAGRGRLRYSASRKFDILEPLGIAEEPYQLHFSVRPEAEVEIESWLEREHLDARDLIVISPGSPVAKKQWCLANYAALADLIQSRTRFKVVLLWAATERPQVETVSVQMKTRPIMAPPTDLHQSAALLKRCRMLVCNDGGINHLAVATGTETLAIFGNTDPVVWSPASVFSHHHHLHNPDFKPGTDSTFGIPAEVAFAEVLRILGEKSGPK
ncbi:MAG TPA: glycosyltransferase family 9 protein [bacterium]|nr:glycosyltransferase family 9 protein [bacterium]